MGQKQPFLSWRMGKKNEEFYFTLYYSAILIWGPFYQYGSTLIPAWIHHHTHFNTLRPRQNGRHFPDDILKWIFLNENVWISIKISLKFVPKGLINNILTLVQIMAWRRSGDKPLFEPMMVSLPMDICITLPQWVKEWDVITHPIPNLVAPLKFGNA